MRIGLYGKALKPEHISAVSQMCHWLITKMGVELLIEEEYYAIIKEFINFPTEIKIVMFNKHSGEFLNSLDFIFSLGGDGTLLSSIDLFQISSVPILGINLGTLGFLAQVNKENVGTAVEMLKAGNFTLEKRDILKIDVFEHSKLKNEREHLETHYALNEVSIRKNDMFMIVIDAFVNGAFLNSYWADGLIVATPTGSTAYSLSCGGPIIHPQTNAWVITPIAPHNLSTRPLVLDNKLIIDLNVSGRSNGFIGCFDSFSKEYPMNTTITVTKANFSLNLVSLGKNTFFDTIRKKLLWGADIREKQTGKK